MSIKQAFTPNTRMADLIHKDYSLIPVFGRFGISYGFGNKTVSTVCEEYNINKWFFLEIVNSYHNSEYFPQAELQNFTAKMIIQYLSNTHAYYLQSKIPEIQQYIDAMEKDANAENQTNIRLLNDFFKEYKEELKTHLDNEDNNVYPYILELEEASETKQTTKKIIKLIKEEPIENYERNHDNIEMKLRDLKNLIIKFLPPVLCKEICQKLLTELFMLESDIANHTRIEDKVLIPKVKQLEQKILEQYEKK